MGPVGAARHGLGAAREPGRRVSRRSRRSAPRVDVITHDAGLTALLTTLIVTLASGGAAGIVLAIVFAR